MNTHSTASPGQPGLGSDVCHKSLGEGTRTLVVVMETDVGSWRPATEYSPTGAIEEGTSLCGMVENLG